MPLSRSLCFQLACVWEATARKPGNVHRYADFDDCTYTDFILSAAAAAPVFDAAPSQGVGETVLAAVEATRTVVRTNTNLGICLLIAPLAAVPDGEPLREGVARVLARTTVEDSRRVYEAIRLAKPGGLGTAGEQDVADEPTLPLREVMGLAADRDRVAAQYVCGFWRVLGMSDQLEVLGTDFGLEQAIVRVFLGQVALGDSLIARKCGEEVARRAAFLAEHELRQLDVTKKQLGLDAPRLDEWLRADGHRRNPGTSADLVAAALYVALREGQIDPLTVRW